MSDVVEQARRRVRLLHAAMVFAPTLVSGVLAAALLKSWLSGVIVAGVVALVAGLHSRERSDEMWLSRLGATAADESQYRRYHNLVDGLCTTAGVPRPGVWVIHDSATNAVALGRGPHNASIVVTTGLLDQLSRIELEGVLASLIGQIRSGETQVRARAAGLAAALLPFGEASASLVGRLLDPGHPVRDDLGGCRITRYPPGLADALETLSAHPVVPMISPPALAHLWMIPVPPASEHAALDERISMLREL